MIEILSHGNQLQRGKYALHSQFHTAVNFLSGDYFVFVVTPEIGSGPLNIVLQGIPLDSLKYLEIQNGWCYLNGEKCFLRDSKKYSAIIDAGNYNRSIFLSNLRFMEQMIVTLSPPKSLAFLLNEKKKNEFTIPYEVEYAGIFECGYKKIFTGDLSGGIQQIKGLGPGLTPSGDDFLCGILFALNVLQKISTIDHTALIDTIYRSGRGSNSFTNAFLLCAAIGQGTAKFNRLINSLFSAESKELTNALTDVVSIGATSGADTATGFLTGLKRFHT